MATRPHLLGLPAELRLRIYSFVFVDASYYHGPDQVPYITKRGRKIRTWDRAKDSFAELKDVTSIVWANQQLRQEALPVLQNNLVAYDLRHNGVRSKNAPLLIRNHASKVIDARDPQECGQRTRSEYLMPLLDEFPCLRQVVWRVPKHAYFVTDISDLGSALSGNKDADTVAAYTNSYKCGTLREVIPHDQGRPCAVSVEILVDIDLTDESNYESWDPAWPDRLENLYRIEVDAFTMTIISRSINLAEDEEEDEDWYLSEEVYLLKDELSWPVLYHKPTAIYKPLIDLWAWYEKPEPGFELESPDSPKSDPEDDEDGEHQEGGGDDVDEDDEDGMDTKAWHIPKKVQELAEEVEEELNDEEVLQKALRKGQKLG